MLYNTDWGWIGVFLCVVFFCFFFLMGCWGGEVEKTDGFMVDRLPATVRLLLLPVEVRGH